MNPKAVPAGCLKVLHPEKELYTPTLDSILLCNGVWQGILTRYARFYSCFHCTLILNIELRRSVIFVSSQVRRGFFRNFS
jgi:hypothetical protein